MAQLIAPRLRATVPDDFEVKEQLTLLAPGGDMNVLFSSEPLDPAIDAERYTSIQGDVLEREFPGYQPMRVEPAPVFGGRPGYRRWFSWQPPPSEDGSPSVPVTQLQAYYAFNGRGYTATATVPSFLLEHHQATMVAIMEKLDIASADTVEDAEAEHPADDP